MQMLQPLSIRDIGLSTGYVLDVVSIHEVHAEVPLLENLEQRNPVNSG